MLKRTYLKITLVIACCTLFTACSGLTKTTFNSSPPPQQSAANTASTSTATSIAKHPTNLQQAYRQPLEIDTHPLPNINKTELRLLKNTSLPTTDLWQRIRNGYTISDHEVLRPETERQLHWFVTHPLYINRVVKRSSPYLHYIVEQLEKRGMPTEIALLPVVESGYQPFAYSHGSAAGLWQFIPGTGKLYGLDQNWWYDGRRDVIESTRAALDYLQKLYNDFGDWQLALAAYNCGEGTVSRAIKRNQQAGKKTDFWSLSLPLETSTYVPKLMAVTYLFKYPEKYNLTLAPIVNSPYLKVVNTDSQIDLAVAAKLADISVDEMYMLNPGFNRWATAPNGPHRLVLPLSKAVNFERALHSLPNDQRMQWTRHKVRRGESLGMLAKHYHTNTGTIKQANNLHRNYLQAGHYLLIPKAAGKLADYPKSIRHRLTGRQHNYSKPVKQRLASRQHKKYRHKKNTKHQHKKHTYTVKNGDTWWNLAQTHNTNVRSLSKWNGKAPGDTLHPGQKLVIWETGNKTASLRTVRTINYTIRDGDSLWKISRKFNVTVAAVREWNRLSSRTLLKPGQNLTLHIDSSHKRKQGSI